MDEETTNPKITKQWLLDTCGDDSISAIARKIRVPQRTLATHVNNGELSAREVIAIAREYNVSPVYALETLGFLKGEEVRDAAIEQSMHDLPLRGLLTAVIDRLDKYVGSAQYLRTKGQEDPALLDFLLEDLLQQYQFGATKLRGEDSPRYLGDDPFTLAAQDQPEDPDAEVEGQYS